ncbi:hypothetical protein [Anaerobaca lacustris]|uniref:Uncharacterized protein n=1 Tax=Anaerobaca lacustris TaxID=3044600 RepID=A0AAW6U782_9BACT|nr:hypothetical protein [Sedimentisphaerales bacterium M17dextr]
MRTGMFRRGVLAALVLVAASVGAEPHTFRFYSITSNNPTDVAIGEAQLSVEVSDCGSEQVLFTFRNEGPEASSIARIYFDNFALGLFEGIGGSRTDRASSSAQALHRRTCRAATT